MAMVGACDIVARGLWPALGTACGAGTGGDASGCAGCRTAASSRNCELLAPHGPYPGDDLRRGEVQGQDAHQGRRSSAWRNHDSRGSAGLLATRVARKARSQLDDGPSRDRSISRSERADRRLRGGEPYRRPVPLATLTTSRAAQTTVSRHASSTAQARIAARASRNTAIRPTTFAPGCEAGPLSRGNSLVQQCAYHRVRTCIERPQARGADIRSGL
jgi:hypothetical protein